MVFRNQRGAAARNRAARVNSAWRADAGVKPGGGIAKALAAVLAPAAGARRGGRAARSACLRHSADQPNSPRAPACVPPAQQRFPGVAHGVARRAARRSGTAHARRCAGIRRACNRRRCGARAGKIRRATGPRGRAVRGLVSMRIGAPAAAAAGAGGSASGAGSAGDGAQRHGKAAANSAFFGLLQAKAAA